MKYNLLIGASSKQWVAMDVSEAGDCDRISFEGNPEVEIHSFEDVSGFCSDILNYYNIDSFSDISFDVKIVVVGEYSEYVRQLFEQVKQSEAVNIIDVKMIIPIYVLKKGLIKQGGTIDVECMDSIFTLSVDGDSMVSFKSEPVGESISLNSEDFRLLYKFDCNNLMSNEREMLELEERHNEEIMVYSSELEKEKENNQALLEKISELEGDLKSIEVENEKLQKNVDTYMKRIIEARKVVYFSEEHLEYNRHQSKTGSDFFGVMSGRSLIAAQNMSNQGHNEESERKNKLYQICRENGTEVIKGMNILKIAKFIVKEGKEDVNTNYGLTIKATKKGKVFYLVKEGQYIEDGMAVAIIGDEYDTGEGIEEWYKAKNNMRELEV